MSGDCQWPAQHVVEQALYRVGDHYDPTSAGQNVADAAAILAALEAAGYRVVPAPKPLAPRLPRCRDVFPGHRKPPPGPASLPRTCALPLDHEGQHGRDGINW